MFPKIADFLRILSLRDRYYPNSKYLNILFEQFEQNFNSSSLDIGCGLDPKNPFKASKIMGLDLNCIEERNVIAGDLSSGHLPFSDSQFNFVTAFDVLEHVPRVSLNNSNTVFPFINLMSEIHRILKPEGIFFASTPCFPFKEVFQDPTHVNIMTEETLRDYFCNDCWATIYGFKGKFKIIKTGWLKKRHFAFLMKVERN